MEKRNINNMTVENFIGLLKTYPQDAPVILRIPYSEDNKIMYDYPRIVYSDVWGVIIQ